MRDIHYLRAQADLCLDMADLMSDGAEAKKLREQAANYRAEASALEAEGSAFEAGERSATEDGAGKKLPRPRGDRRTGFQTVIAKSGLSRRS